jgi:oligoribonuclease
MLDVSAWKVVMQGKYGVQFEKKEVHRAFDDIQASIAELQHYLEWFRNGSQNS